MNAATLDHSRDAFAPKRPGGMSAGLALALLAHILLIVALAIGVNWRASEPEGVTAELWSALPQTAAPRAEAPVVTAAPIPVPKPAPPVVEPRPQPVVEPPRPQRVEPAPPPRVDPQIAIERAAKERAARIEVERREAARQVERRAIVERQAERQAEREAERKAEAKAAAEQERRAEAERKKKEAEQAKQEEVRLAASREAYMKRVMGQAGGGDAATAPGTAARTSGPSAGYAGRIKARIKPNIVWTASVSGNPTAEVEVRCAADGTIIGRRITKSSGSTAWDETVLRALDKTSMLPRDTDGTVPSPMLLSFRPNE